ncbi:MAG: undecaprenyldiphospho-muramoylpentapeptide beta-N-acetylglucosaminyltransferase [Gammaproteobacteria bacterium]|nr:undecaprenyldiphospho-muramoylpentapeptide beta-N-acetylglucosaminyltransferase [Gammaproteobacteria bacterium]
MKISNPEAIEKKIVLTGGGSAGHVTPNLALIPELQAQGWTIDYIGSAHGVERNMIKAVDVPYHEISTGKLRRYFSWQNFLDPFRVVIGMVQAFRLIRKLKPQVIFSKGGFVALPVVIGGWFTRTPIVVHESDFSVGLANRLSFPFADKICVTFEAAKRNIKNKAKVVVTGTPIRETLLQGTREAGLKRCGFHGDKPCILVMGGGHGARAINDCIRQSLTALLSKVQVIHLCGPGKIDASLKKRAGYVQFEYANEELPDLLAATDLVITRAGANSLYELLVLAKPHILIPLPRLQSRGDQIQNAHHFERLGVSHVIEEERLTTTTLLAAVETVMTQREAIVKKIAALHIKSAVQTIVNILNTKNVL